VPLAYLTAKTHGLGEEAARLYEKINSRAHDLKVQQVIQQQNLSEPPELPVEDVASRIRGVEKPRLLLPPIPIIRNGGNWPHLTVSRGPFEAPAIAASSSSAAAAKGATAPKVAAVAAAADLEDEDESGWGEDVNLGGAAKSSDDTALDGESGEGANGAGDEEENAWDDLDLPDLPKPAKKAASHAHSTPQINLPREGPSWPSLWGVNSDVPADHVAAGSFESAMQLLSSQIGATNFAPMKPYFMRLYQGARARLIAQPSTSSLEYFLLRNPESAGSRDGLPQLAITVSELIDKVQLGYRATTAGKFQEAVDAFKSVFAALPLVSVNSSSELAEVKEVLTVCTDYVLGIQTELKRKGSFIKLSLGNSGWFELKV
jgi:coatomer protein complex subunit alpha (xenin)